MLIRLEGDGALHERLYRGLRAAIHDGRLAPRSRLPSTRELARDLRVSRNVVVGAFGQLHSEGYIEGRIGSGTYVAAMLPDPSIKPYRSIERTGSRPGGALSQHAQAVVALRPLPVPGQPRKQRLPFDFRYGQPGLEDFPQATWTRLVTRHARMMSSRTLAYGRVRGFGPLREALAEYLHRVRGVRASVDQLVIVNGTQQALDLAGRMLIDRGDPVVVEDPGYLAARQVFQGLGARVLATRVDASGLDVAKLPRGRAIRLAYVTPSHQFPLGGVLPVDRRVELLRWAEHCGAYVLEDDYDTEFRYDMRPVEALQGLDGTGRVLYLGSFSKVLFPSLRLGYLVVPQPLVEATMALKYLADGPAPTFEQEVLTELIRDGHFERHIRRMRALYAARRATLLDALAHELGDRVEVVGAEAGLHIVIYVRGVGPGDVPALIERAAAAGVGIYPLDPYYAERGNSAGVIVGYASLGEHDLRAGVRALRDAL